MRLHAGWVLDLRVPGDVWSIGEGWSDCLRRDWTTGTGKQGAVGWQNRVIPPMSLWTQKLRVVGAVILLQRGGGRLDREDDSVAGISPRPSSHLSTGEGQHFGGRCDGSVAMKGHQILQELVADLLPHDEETAVLRHVDHEMLAAALSSGEGEEGGRRGGRGEGGSRKEGGKGKERGRKE